MYRRVCAHAQVSGVPAATLFLSVLSTVSWYYVKNTLWAQMSEDPTVTLKPIGLKLSTAPTTAGRVGWEGWSDRERGETDECDDNLCSGLTYSLFVNFTFWKDTQLWACYWCPCLSRIRLTVYIDFSFWLWLKAFNKGNKYVPMGYLTP